MATAYRNFDLLVERRGVGYRARVQDSPAGEAVVDFHLPFTADELRTFPWLSSRVSQGLGLASSAASATPPLDIRQFGERLFNAAFAGDVGACFLLSLAETGKTDTGLRIRLRLDPDVPELAELPWEYLYAPQLNSFLALSDRVALVRYVQQLQPPSTLNVTPPLVLLVLAPQPHNVPRLKIEEEWNSLQQALADLQGQGWLRVERLPAATPEALLDRLRGDGVHLLHFMGPASSMRGRGQGGSSWRTQPVAQLLSRPLSSGRLCATMNRCVWCFSMPVKARAAMATVRLPGLHNNW